MSSCTAYCSAQCTHTLELGLNPNQGSSSVLSVFDIHVLMRGEKEGRKTRSNQGQTNNKAKQHSIPKAVTFPKKNELPRVDSNPQHSIYTHVHCTCTYITLSIYMYMYFHDIVLHVCVCVCDVLRE